MDVDHEEGPATPQGAPKRWTGAEQMNAEQEEYEHRVPEEEDSIGKVHKHNATYPKLSDELDKRRSTADPKLQMKSHPTPMTATGVVAASGKRFDPRCRACRRLKALTYLQKMELRPRCESRDRSNQAPKTKRSAINKAAVPRSSAPRGAVCKCPCHRRRQRPPPGRQRPLFLASTSEYVCLSADEVRDMRKQGVPIQILNVEDAKAGDSREKRGKEKPPSNVSLRSNNRSERSGSSLRSFGSLNEEPMV